MFIAFSLLSAVLVIGGLADTDPLSLVVGFAFGGGAFAAYRWRCPAMVVVHLIPGPQGGTEVLIEGRDGLLLSDVVRTVAAAKR